MENASKALIIAGAILLSILIIGLGIFIFGQARNSLSSTNLSEYEIKVFNSKFETFTQSKARISNSIYRNKYSNEAQEINIYRKYENLELEIVTYENNAVKGKDVKELLNILMLHNSSKNDETLKIGFGCQIKNKPNGTIGYAIGIKNNGTLQTISNIIYEEKGYTIELIYNKANGLIEAIKITGGY